MKAAEETRDKITDEYTKYKDRAHVVLKEQTDRIAELTKAAESYLGLKTELETLRQQYQQLQQKMQVSLFVLFWRGMDGVSPADSAFNLFRPLLSFLRRNLHPHK